MLDLLISGLAIGSVYVLLSLGLVVVFNTTGAVNFAQGGLAVLGGYLGTLMASWIDPAVPFIIIFGTLSMAAIGVLVAWTGYEPLKGRPLEAVFISTIAIGLAIEGIERVGWGPAPRSVLGLGGYWKLGSHTIVTRQDALVVGVTMVLVTSLFLFYKHTQLGRELRAVAQDATAAVLVGINRRKVITIAFILAGGVAGLAGVLAGPLVLLTPGLGNTFIIDAYIATVIGGFGRLGGSVVGGLLLGVAEIFIAAYVSSAYEIAIVYMLLLVVLVVRPNGIFGDIVGERS